MSKEISPRDLGRCAVELARIVPELVPAFLWLMAAGGRSVHVKAFRTARPSAEELAALAAYVGPPVVEILSHKKTLMKQVEGIYITDRDLLTVRATALRRLGLGVESLISL